MSDIKQTSEWAKYMSKTGWKVVKLNQNYLYIKKLPFFGSYIRIPRPSLPLNLSKIDQIARDNKALLIKITPKISLNHPKANLIDKTFLRAGYQKDFWTSTVSKTMILDLNKDKNQLLKSFHKKTRQYIRLAKRNGITVIKSDDIHACFKLYQESAERHGFSTSSFEDINERFTTFNRAKKAILLFAKTASNQLLAVLLLLLNPAEKQAVTAVAGLSSTNMHLRASYLLHWETIRLAKRWGFKKFDFDGIGDNRFRNFRIWQGVTFFKKGFGGKEITYLGSYLKGYHPLLKIIPWLYSKLYHFF